MLTGIRVEISVTEWFWRPLTGSGWRCGSRPGTKTPDVEAAVLVPAKTLAEAAKTGLDGSEVQLALGMDRRSARTACRDPQRGQAQHHPAAGRRVPSSAAAAHRTHRDGHHRRR